MKDQIAVLETIKQACEAWSEGRRVPTISKKLAGKQQAVMPPVFLTTVLNYELFPYGLYSLPPLSVLAIFLMFELNRPGGWDEVIDKELRVYEPRDREAWKILRTTVLRKGKLEHDDVRSWLEAERKANADLLNAPETALGYCFVRREVKDE
mgnify:FL=1